MSLLGLPFGLRPSGKPRRETYSLLRKGNDTLNWTLPMLTNIAITCSYSLLYLSQTSGVMYLQSLEKSSQVWVSAASPLESESFATKAFSCVITYFLRVACNTPDWSLYHLRLVIFPIMAISYLRFRNASAMLAGTERELLSICDVNEKRSSFGKLLVSSNISIASL